MWITNTSAKRENSCAIETKLDIINEDKEKEIVKEIIERVKR